MAGRAMASFCAAVRKRCMDWSGDNVVSVARSYKMEIVSRTSQRDPCSRSLLTFSIRCSMLCTALTPVIKLASKHTHQLALVPPVIGRLYYIGMSQSGEKNMTSQLQPMPLFTASICALIQLDRAQSTPLYQQICEKLREAIHSGQLAEGTRLPTERALAKELGVNRTTVMNAEHILILSGSTQGIGLVSRFLLSPGDEVVVEVPTYLGAIQTFRALGARVLGVPMDNDGMRVDLLESILARHRPRLIYTLPTFQNPTGVVMSPDRRRRLLLLARRYQTPILEDDPYGAVYFDEGKRPQPL